MIHCCLQKLKNHPQSFCACLCRELLFGAKSHNMHKDRGQLLAWYVCNTTAQLFAYCLVSCLLSCLLAVSCLPDCACRRLAGLRGAWNSVRQGHRPFPVSAHPPPPQIPATAAQVCWLLHHCGPNHKLNLHLCTSFNLLAACPWHACDTY